LEILKAVAMKIDPQLAEIVVAPAKPDPSPWLNLHNRLPIYSQLASAHAPD
jgi:hypothetical protein